MTALKPDLPTLETEAAKPPVNRPKLSATQLTASVLAAVTATVAASYLGVAGTVIGAALASVLTVVGNAVYGHSLARTGERVRAAVPTIWLPSELTSASDATADLGTAAPPAERVKETGDRTLGLATRGNLRRLGLACVGLFAVINVAIFAVELAAGKPLSDIVRGQSASGTTLGGYTTRTADRTPTPVTTVTVTPSVVVTTPTVTQTAPPVTSTVTPTVTSTPTATPSSTPTSPPGATGTPTP